MAVPAAAQDLFLEVLSQTLEQVVQQSSKRSVPVPPHLVVVADNTVAGVKNSYGCRFLSYLVAQNLFRTTTLFSLMVGHTHEAGSSVFCAGSVHHVFHICAVICYVSHVISCPGMSLHCPCYFIRAIALSFLFDFMLSCPFLLI